MSQHDSSKYYWFKCTHEFFNSTEFRCLETARGFDLNSLEGFYKDQICGLAIQAIYMKLITESCTHGGELLFDDETPYDLETLSQIVGCSEEFLSFALEKLKKLNLLLVDDYGKIILRKFQKYVGSETFAARRMRQKTENEEEIVDYNKTVSENQAKNGRSAAKSGEKMSKFFRPYNRVIENKSIRLKGNPPSPLKSSRGVEQQDEDNGEQEKIIDKPIVIPKPPKVERPEATQVASKMVDELLIENPEIKDTPEFEKTVQKYAKLVMVWGEDFIQAAIDDFEFEIQNEGLVIKNRARCLYSRISEYTVEVQDGKRKPPSGVEMFVIELNEIGARKATSSRGKKR